MKFAGSRGKSMSYQRYVQKKSQRQDEPVEGNIDTTSSDLLCRLCNLSSTIFDVSTGETVCTNCGAVILERPMILENDPKSKERLGMSVSLIFPDKGLSTVITNANTDAFGTSLNQAQISNVNKIRYLDKVSNTNRTQIRNLKHAFATMAIVKDRLRLTDPLMERAAYYYRKTLHNKLIKGRSIREMVVASVYAACKEMNVPRTLYEICSTINADPIFAGKCYRTMAKRLKIGPSIVDATRYVSKIADNAYVTQKTYRRAVDMLDIVKQDAISYGKDPKALATAALYAACLSEHESKVSQARIAGAGGVSIVTLRKRFSDILKIFPESSIENSKPVK
jgi:transcription initiation factor TFIIB